MAELVDLKRKIAELEAKGSFNEAIEELESAIGEFPSEGSLYNKLGDLYLRVNQQKNALSAYEKGARAFKEETYFPNAIALCKKILRFDKNRTEIYGLLGELHKDLDQRGEAANYLLEYADRKRRANDLDTALKTYDMIRELVPNNARILKTISAIYEQVGKKDRGSELLEQAKEIETKHEKFKEIVLEEKIKTEVTPDIPEETPEAEVEEKTTGKIAEVEEPIRLEEIKPVEKDRQAKDSISIEDIVSPEVAELLKDEQRSSSVGVDITEKLSEIDKTIELGELYLKLDSIEEAIDCFRDAENAAWRSKDYDKALNLNKKIADLRPFDLKSRQHLVEIARMRKDNDTQVTFMLELAEALNRREAKSEAKKIYRDVLRIDPENVVAKERVGPIGPAAPPEKAASAVDLGEVLRIEQSEAKAQAMQSIEELVSEFRREVFESIGEGDYTSHYDLGVAYKGMGLYQEAVEELEIAAKDEKLKLKALEMIGASYLDYDKVDDAIRVLSESLEIEGHGDKEYFGIHFLLGNCHEKRNELRSALKSYVNAYNIDKKVPALNQKILQLKQKVTDELEKRRKNASGGNLSDKSASIEQKVDRKSKITYL
ncbi:MAG: tetratricopeptide repeat protein [candidate division WOR-3 bacterium]|nr:tetratricopeptide repeat protein [candidate division WOR-3 bacterium]